MEIKRIIIEGPDCSGKSTLVDRIKNTIKWDARALRHKDDDQFERYFFEYASADKVVFDRGHFSENVYSKLWRGGSPFSASQMKILNLICREKTLIIFACPSLKTIKKRYLTRNYQQQIKLEEIELSRKLFISQLKGIKKIVYKSENYEELEKLLVTIKKLSENK